jgi:hypothetical protein
VPKKPVAPLLLDSNIPTKSDEIESAYHISMEQLSGAKLFPSREEYAKTVKPSGRYLEVGVAWGYSVDLFGRNASSMTLVDWFNQDLKCWSWRKFGSCQCEGMKHELLYLPETHEQYIQEKYADRHNVVTVKGGAPGIIDKLSDEEFDFAYIDISNERIITRDTMQKVAKLIAVGGVLGMNDYLIYDGVIEDEPYGTYQTVNEFLHNNRNWSVDAIALHPLGFYDIYLRRNK